MGIKTDQNDAKAPTFTRDVIRIEKSGPDEEHLTLIDVPGIFENETSQHRLSSGWPQRSTLRESALLEC
jgi:hypothetical protein